MLFLFTLFLHTNLLLFQEPPFVIRNSTGNKTLFTGYAIDTFDIVARRLGLQYTLYEVQDNQYGTLNPDGTWSGIMGELVTGVRIWRNNMFVGSEDYTILYLFPVVNIFVSSVLLVVFDTFIIG